MTDFLHIQSLAQLTTLLGIAPLRHPLALVVDLSDFAVPAGYTGLRMTNAFYAVSFKARVGNAGTYGRKSCDFENGVLTATAPGQVFVIPEAIEKGDYAGWALFIHPDLIHGSSLSGKIKGYSFFNYNADEALHLSEKEQTILQGLVQQIASECEEAGDEYNFDILASGIELLLNFIKRYYARQFNTRKVAVTGTVARFQELVDKYLKANLNNSQPLPAVGYFAEQLHFSSGYLSDLLKKSTGKTAQELLHYHLIEKAKHLLLSSEATVAEISYQLGFEYPAYFSRVFKKKTGRTPGAYRNHLDN